MERIELGESREQTEGRMHRYITYVLTVYRFMALRREGISQPVWYVELMLVVGISVPVATIPFLHSPLRVLYSTTGT